MYGKVELNVLRDVHTRWKDGKMSAEEAMSRSIVTTSQQESGTLSPGFLDRYMPILENRRR